ncbi:uncharacterized protein V2V93DRAFT_387675 [Kockiozyma suomiensis]|uniref:uncharacterized protein n=1 Tax=Kockiozyma suomiensis TaxID=1337062 RepID=UPI0033437A21
MSQPTGPPAQAIWKKMAFFCAGTVAVYIVVKSQLNERRRIRYEEERRARREPGHEYQKIAEVERRSDGAANPSSEEANDPSYGRKRSQN